MILAILANCWLLSAAPTAPRSADPSLPYYRIFDLSRQGYLARFHLDLGCCEIYGAHASLSPEFVSVRLPASVTRAGKSEPEIDFLSNDLRDAVLGAVSTPASNFSTSAAPYRSPGVNLASLEPVKTKKGVRIAKAEIWLGGFLAVKVSLMKSKWSESPDHWWVAYPSEWKHREKRYEDLFLVKDKAFKKKITKLLREAYLDRYGE